MIDFFRKRTAADFKAQAQETYKLPEIAPIAPPRRSTTAYQIGKTEDGQVTLTLGDYGNVVTMTNAGVDQLIRMLTAAKEVDSK